MRLFARALQSDGSSSCTQPARTSRSSTSPAGCCPTTCSTRRSRRASPGTRCRRCVPGGAGVPGALAEGRPPHRLAAPPLGSSSSAMPGGRGVLLGLHERLTGRARAGAGSPGRWKSASCTASGAEWSRDPEDAWLRIKEARPLRGQSGRSRAGRRRLARAPGGHARPAGAVRDLGPRVVGIAQRAPPTLEDLRRVRGLDDRQTRGGSAGEILAAVSEGREELAGRRRRDPAPPEIDTRLAPAVTLVSAWVSQLSKNLGIDTALVATRSDIEEFLARGRATVGSGADGGATCRRAIEAARRRSAALAFDGQGGLVLEERSGEPICLAPPPPRPGRSTWSCLPDGQAGRRITAWSSARQPSNGSPSPEGGADELDHQWPSRTTVSSWRRNPTSTMRGRRRACVASRRPPRACPAASGPRGAAPRSTVGRRGAAGTGRRSRWRRPGRPRRCARRARAATAATGRWCPSRGRGRRPRQRRSTAVAAARVDDPVGRHDGVLEAQLLPGVEERRAPQAGQEERRGAGPGLGAAVAGPLAHGVMARQHPGGPADRVDQALDLVDPLPKDFADQGVCNGGKLNARCTPRPPS